MDISCFLSPEQVMWNDDELDHEMTDAQRRRFVKCKETNLDKISIIIMAGPYLQVAITHARRAYVASIPLAFQ